MAIEKSTIKGSKYVFFIVIFTSYILNNAVFILLDSSSLRLGMMLGMVTLGALIIAVNKNSFTLINLSYLRWLFILCILVFFQTIASFLMFNDDNFLRAFMSLGLFFITSIIAPYVVNIADTVEDASFHKIIKFTYQFLFSIGILAFILQKLNLVAGKSMILFREPSHYALIYLPFLLYVCYYNRKNLIPLFFGLLLAILLQNATLLVGILFIFVLKFWKTKKMLSGVFIFFILIIQMIGLERFEYFIDRFTISSSSNNLSVLVWLSGWERALLSFVESIGVGIGFNQLGYIDLHGNIMRKIYDLMGGQYLNLYDGGSVASKLIAETGVTGVIIILLYLFYCIKAIGRLLNGKTVFPMELFFTSVYIMFFVQMFFRGVGYFSPSVFVFISSVYWLYRMNVCNKRVNHIQN